MDLSSINKSNSLNNKNIAFQGNKTVKNDYGETRLRVYPPYIELGENEELGIELVKLSNINDERGYDWRITSPKPIRVKTDDEFKRGAKTSFDIDLKSKWLDKSGEVGYRYIVYDKKTNNVKRAYTDSIGSVIENKLGEFTVASTRQGTPQMSGSMEHIYTDSWNVIHKVVPKNATPEDYDNAASTAFKRTHFNKAGGTIRGIIETLRTGLSAFVHIMTTPLTGGGKIASHKYHPWNSFQVSEGTGTKQDFLDLQVECFKNGKGYSLDGAFTSQGFEGVQLNHALKHKDSPFRSWFKNPPSSGSYGLGALPDTDNSHTGVRVVNPMGVEGYKYDPTMPTYVQLYDTRLTSKDQLEDYGKLIEEYDVKDVDDPYEITTHQDAVLCNYFEVDPSSAPYKGNTFGTLAEWKDKQASVLAPKNRYFEIVKANDASGYTGWDGSLDLVKMNLSNHSSSKELIQGCNQARNYMYNVARYWTEETRNALIMDIAQEIYNKRIKESKNQDAPTKAALKYLDEIEEKFPQIQKKGTLADIYGRVMKEKRAYEHESVPVEKSYEYKIYDDKRDPNTFLKEEILNFPLESLNFSSELIAVLSTPYITPRPSDKGDPAASKTEIYKDAVDNSGLSKTMQKVYSQQLPAAVKKIMYTIEQEQINDKNDKLGLKKLFTANGDSLDEITPYGKYFLEMAMSDIMQFVITESLFDEDTFPVYKDGKLDYTSADKKLGTKGNGRRLTLNKLGIYDADSKEEAEKVAKKLSKGLENLENKKPEELRKFINYLEERYFKLDPEDYKIAEAVVDKTGAGLNWRFDAAKDVGDWDEAAKGQITSGDVWDDVIGFWKPFVKEVKDLNPSSYVIAEVTSLHDFDKYNWGKYGNADKAEKAFYQETGATTGSNYSTYFGLYPKLFGKNIEEGNVENYRSITNFLKKTQDFIKPEGNDGHVTSEFILGSHVFIDNHDKPRAAHLMGVDAALFWSDFQRDGKLVPEYTKRAEKVLGREYADDMSSKAVAVAEQYMNYFDKKCNELGLDENNKKIINDAIRHLANGYKYKSKNDATPSYKKANSFGQMPFEITIPHVIKQAEAMGAKLNKSEKRTLENDVRALMVAPYMSKMTAIYELMSGTVGIPTIFSGDEFGQTGSETKSKNTALGCRNITRHDYIEGNTKEDVIEFNSRLKSTGMLSKKPGMGALANGTPIVVMPKEADYMKNTTKDELIAALENVGHNNFDDLKGACGFLDCVKGGNPEFNTIISTLKGMSEADIKTKLREQLKTVHPGMADWVKTNIKNATKKAANEAETGAIYKYNDRGEGVITMVTNAYIPEDVSEISPLRSSAKDNITPPKVSSVILKDTNGNLIAKPGTTFIRKTYSEQAGDYIDNGIFTLTKNGMLINQDGKEATLDSTVTYFCKCKPSIYTAYTKLVG